MSNQINLDIDENTKQASQINPNSSPLPIEIADIENAITFFLEKAGYQDLEAYKEGENKIISEAGKIDRYLKNVLQLICTKIVHTNKEQGLLVRSLFDSINKTVDCLRHTNINPDLNHLLPLVIGYTLKCYKENLTTNNKTYN